MPNRRPGLANRRPGLANRRPGRRDRREIHRGQPSSPQSPQPRRAPESPALFHGGCDGGLVRPVRGLPRLGGARERFSARASPCSAFLQSFGPGSQSEPKGFL